MAIPDAVFLAVRFYSYTIYVARSTIGILNDSYACCSVLQGLRLPAHAMITLWLWYKRLSDKFSFFF